MGPKFMPILYFRCDGTLEVCGPTNFVDGDVLLEITMLTIEQNGHVMSCSMLPNTTVAPNPEWECTIPNAKGTFVVGPARGAAQGYGVTRSAGRGPLAWPGALQLEDGCAILQAIAPDSVPVWNAYVQSGGEYER